MRLDRLQGVPKRTPVAVINDQRNASVLGDAVPNALDDGLRWGTGFHKITLFGVRQPIRKCGVRRSLGQRIYEILPGEGDATLAPCLLYTSDAADE